MNEPEKRPMVGIGVMVIKDGKILLGKRKNSHGAGNYAFPGGSLEYMESFEHCATRELEEEVGIAIGNIRFLRILNLKDYSPKHFIDLALLADWKGGEPTVKEPEKCEAWGWYDIDNLPAPLFGGIPSAIEAYKTGKNYFDR